MTRLILALIFLLSPAFIIAQPPSFRFLTFRCQGKSEKELLEVLKPCRTGSDALNLLKKFFIQERGDKFLLICNNCKEGVAIIQYPPHPEKRVDHGFWTAYDPTIKTAYDPTIGIIMPQHFLNPLQTTGDALPQSFADNITKAWLPNSSLKIYRNPMEARQSAKYPLNILIELQSNKHYQNDFHSEAMTGYKLNVVNNITNTSIYNQFIPIDTKSTEAGGPLSRDSTYATPSTNWKFLSNKISEILKNFRETITEEDNNSVTVIIPNSPLRITLDSTFGVEIKRINDLLYLNRVPFFYYPGMSTYVHSIYIDAKDLFRTLDLLLNSANIPYDLTSKTNYELRLSKKVVK